MMMVSSMSIAIQAVMAVAVDDPADAGDGVRGRAKPKTRAEADAPSPATACLRLSARLDFRGFGEMVAVMDQLPISPLRPDERRRERVDRSRTRTHLSLIHI